ncbi:MAG: ABC transporter substrate-binding protein [Alphaproteobacteria bacterium]|nr:ABC transporter substrate-binding protein [Alphaproteobacteria bacterium]
MPTKRFLTPLALAAMLVMMPDAPADAQQPQRGGTLSSIISPEPPTLMIGISQTTPTAIVAGKIYESLLRYSTDLKPMPGLAKSWEVSEDGRTYTFRLHENVKWHDGQPFTAEDVVFTATKYLIEVHPRSRPIMQRAESVTAPDRNTVVFRLKEPFAPFIMAWEPSTAPIVPKHIYDGTNYRNNPANQTPIGTGPFKLQEWVRGSHIHLVRNDEYWQPGKPYLDAIYYRVLPDAGARVVAMETGQTHLSAFADIETFEVPRLKAMPHLELTTKGYEYLAQMVWLDFNLRNPPMNDRRFRQAVYYAMDRDFIRDRIWFGLGKIATGPIHSSIPHYDANVPKYPLDLKKSEQLLDEMGLKRGTDGVRVRVTLDALPYGDIYKRLAEYTKQALARVGIEVTIRTSDVAGWGDRVRNWDYEMTHQVLSQLGHPALGVSRLYITSNIRKGVLFSNVNGYTNPRIDELFSKAAVAVEPAQIQAMYSEIQRILVEDVPVAWLLELEFPTFINKQFRNVVTSGIGVRDNFADVHMVRQ